jgi:flagellar biogenesis protein FliO
LENPTVSLLISLIAISLLFAGVYYLNKKLGTAAIGNRKSKYMKTLDRLALARDRWIEMVQVGEEIMIIGVSAQSFQILKTIPAESLAMVDAEGPEGGSFKSLLDKFMNRNSK